MNKEGEDWRPDFEHALGETFAEYVSPPVPFEEVSPHECCEVVWAVAGRDVTPARLAALREDQVSDLARKFSEYFDCDAPTVEQVRDAIAKTLAWWPVGSLGEPAGPGNPINVGRLAEQYLAGRLSFDDFMLAAPEDPEDEEVAELIDLIEHEPKRGGFLGASPEDHDRHMARVRELARSISSRG